MSTMASNDLTAIPDPEFRSLVADALKFTNSDYSGDLTHDTVEGLKSPEVVDRTYLVLVSMKKAVEGQLAARRADYIVKKSKLRGNTDELRELEDEYHRWRAGSLRFKSGVEAFMVTLRGRRKEMVSDGSYYLAYESLRQAIQKHKETVLDALENDKDTDADEVLWAFVESHP